MRALRGQRLRTTRHGYLSSSNPGERDLNLLRLHTVTGRRDTRIPTTALSHSGFIFSSVRSRPRPSPDSMEAAWRRIAPTAPKRQSHQQRCLSASTRRDFEPATPWSRRPSLGIRYGRFRPGGVGCPELQWGGGGGDPIQTGTADLDRRRQSRFSHSALSERADS